MVTAAVEALRKGDRQQAVGLLAQALQNDARDQQAWLWLAVAHPEAARKIYCLEKLLALQADQPPAQPPFIPTASAQQALAALRGGASSQTVERFLVQQLETGTSPTQTGLPEQAVDARLPGSPGAGPVVAADDSPAFSEEAGRDQPAAGAASAALPAGETDATSPNRATQASTAAVQPDLPPVKPQRIPNAPAPVARPPARRRSFGCSCLLVALGLLGLVLLVGAGLAALRPDLVQELAPALGLPALIQAPGPTGQPVSGPAGTRRPGVILPPTWTPTASQPASATPPPPTRRATSTPASPTAVVSVTPLARDRVLVIGRSAQNRPIEVYRFGRGRRERMIVAGIHGSDEQNTIELAELLIAHLQNNPRLVPRDMTLYILRSLNPDAEARGSGEQEPPEPVRLNANGVDLNRNFPVGWQQSWDSVGCSSEPGTAGAFPGSEPETQSFINFIHTRQVELVVSYHSAYLGVFPSGSPEHPESARLAEAISATAGYDYPPLRNGCEYTGTLVDWAAANGVIAAVDLELNSPTDAEFEKNLKVLDLILNWGLPTPMPVPTTVLPSITPTATPRPTGTSEATLTPLVGPTGSPPAALTATATP